MVVCKWAGCLFIDLSLILLYCVYTLLLVCFVGMPCTYTTQHTSNQNGASLAFYDGWSSILEWFWSFQLYSFRVLFLFNSLHWKTCTFLVRLRLHHAVNRFKRIACNNKFDFCWIFAITIFIRILYSLMVPFFIVNRNEYCLQQMDKLCNLSKWTRNLFRYHKENELERWWL